MKKTLILGATTNPSKYAFKAAGRLTAAGYDIVPYGIKKGEVFGVEILNDWTEIGEVHTVTMYVGAARQSEYYEKIVALNPKRVLFNPGTENPEFYNLLNKAGIETEEACTLVLLSLGEY